MAGSEPMNQHCEGPTVQCCAQFTFQIIKHILKLDKVNIKCSFLNDNLIYWENTAILKDPGPVWKRYLPAKWLTSYDQPQFLENQVQFH